MLGTGEVNVTACEFFRKCWLLWVLPFLALMAIGCDTAYYKTMEKFGYEKRDILVSRVREARSAQEDAKEEFRSALDKFKSVVNFKGGKLEAKYEELNAAYERSEDRADSVRDRIESVENVARDLFAEWDNELDQYSNTRLRQDSSLKLKETKRQYNQLIRAMKLAEKKIDPVLSAFKDQVLYLKHNLNARAIASLKSELVSVESNVASLIKEMEASIKEADVFIGEMGKS